MTFRVWRIAALCVAAFVATHTAPAHAQTYESWPSRRVSLLVGFAAGGFADNTARILARKLGERWKQPVVVQNMAGAGGNIAAHAVAVAAPDGYTLLATTTSLAINETVYQNKGFSSDSVTTIAIPVEAPELLASNPKSDVKTFADMMRKAKAGTLYMGSPGIGSGSHISAEYFFRVVAKTQVKHIPFSGGNPAMLALLTGDISIMASTATVISSILDGQLIGVTVGSVNRNPFVPNVPTYAENGYPGFTASSWAGLFAPAGTPEPVLDKINADVNEALNDPEVRRQFQTMGLLSASRTRADAAAFFKSEIAHWGTMVKAIGLSE